MTDQRSLSRVGAWWVRRRHRSDWTFDSTAMAGDTSLRIRRQSQPLVTASIRRLQKDGTGSWEGRRQIDRTGRMTLANVSGIAVGYVYVVDDAADRSGWCLLDDVVVAPDMRNRGIGRALMAEMALWLSEDGYETIYGLASAGTSINDHGGLRGWYQRMGFAVTDDRGDMRADITRLVDLTTPFLLT